MALTVGQMSAILALEMHETGEETMSTVPPSDPSQSSAMDENDKGYRLNLRLSKEAKEALDYIAEKRGINYAEAIRRALGTEQFFLQAQQRNASIVLEEDGKRPKEVLLR